MIGNLKFRDADLARRIVERIHRLASDHDMIKICHVCGTHEWTITHYGIRSLLPSNVEVIAGPDVQYASPQHQRLMRRSN